MLPPNGERRGCGDQHTWWERELDLWRVAAHTKQVMSDHSPSEFRRRCPEKLERLGDAAMESWRHDTAVKYYTAALSFHPANTRSFLIIRSKTCMAKGLWEDALNDVNEVRPVISFVQIPSC